MDAIIAENPGKSLDELVASKKINADQKAQAQKKPGLQNQLAQIEEQLAQYKKIDGEYQAQAASSKQELEEKHRAELERVRESAKDEAEAKVKNVVKQKLLLFSQFLRAAAAKRIVEEEADTEESKAFEGALLLVYGGDEKAVEAAENIVEGSDDFVPSVEGQALNVKCKFGHIQGRTMIFTDILALDSQLKALTVQHAPYTADASYEEAVGADTTSTPQAAGDSVSDPTITHAGLTELDSNQPLSTMAAEEKSELPAQVSAGNENANLAAGRTLNDTSNTTGVVDGSEESFEIVPRDPAETETPHVPAPVAQTNSWADDSAEAAANAAATVTPAEKDDGFHEVQGRRGGHRGHRGDGEGRGRGRGRGGYRGGERGRGGFRGERRGGGGEGRGRGPRGPPRGS